MNSVWQSASRKKNGHYECCRIFYEEIDKIVEGSRRGIPEFYIVLGENENRESFFLLDEEEQDRTDRKSVV